MEQNAYDHLIPQVFLFNERRCFPDWSIGKRQNDFHDLTFVIEGKANYYVNDVKYTLEAGDLLYIPPGFTREAHTFKDEPMYAYPFNFHWLAPHNETKLPFDIVTKHMITQELIDLIHEFKHVWMNQQPLYRLQARAIFELMLHRLLMSYYRHAGQHMDPRILKVMRLVAKQYHEPINVAQMAELLQLHPVYFGKLFKQYTGQTFKQYVNVIRINNAEMMLSSGDFTVTETAERCGFSDVAYFSNLFKLMKGYPPSSVKHYG